MKYIIEERIESKKYTKWILRKRKRGMHFVDLFLLIPAGEDSDETVMNYKIVGTRVRLPPKRVGF